MASWNIASAQCATDTIAPTAVCPASPDTVYLDAAGTGVLPADIGDGSSTDNCVIPTETSPSVNVTCDSIGVRTVLLTASDTSGNSNSIACTYTVLDTTAPTLVCQDLIIFVDAAGSFDNNALNNGGIITRTDNCALDGTPFGSGSPPFPCGDFTQTVTQFDVSGNSSQCFINYTLIDTFPPTAVCPASAPVVYLDGTGNGTLPADIGDGSSTDNCTVTETSMAVGVTCANLGTQNVDLIATDPSGNADTVTCTFSVEDTVDPVAVCPTPAPVVYLDGSGNGTLPMNIGDGSSTDNCGTAIEASNPQSVNCSNTTGSNVVILAVSDGNGNSSTAICFFTVEDTLAPSATCPANIADVALDGSGNGTLPANIGDGSSSDNCGATETSASATFGCGDVGPQTVELIATDAAGNADTATCSFNVVDNEAPTITCPSNASVNNEFDSCSAVVTGLVATAADNCGPVTITNNSPYATSSGADASGRYPVGTTVVQFIATDAYGNADTCETTVTVNDNQLPIASCLLNIAVSLNGDGEVFVGVNLIDNNSNDNCGIASRTLSKQLYTCADIGFNSVALTVTDLSGNQNICVTNIDVQDNIKPNAICQAGPVVAIDSTGNVVIDGSTLDGGSTDNCSIASYLVSPSSFTCSDIGSASVLLTVIDIDGNQDTCSSTVSIVDNTAPIAVCQDVNAVLDSAGNASITTMDINGGSSDNCGIDSMAIDISSFNCTHVGVNIVTLSLWDASGNMSSCSDTVNVIDNISPVISCMDISVNLDSSGSVTIDSNAVDAGSSDACGIASISVAPATFTCSEVGSNAVTMTVTDANGNSSNCSATVTVSDVTNPEAICADITVQLDSNGNATISATMVDGGSGDACGIDTTTIDNASFDCTNLGANTVTLTVTDVNGNSSTCDATVTVEDNIAPAAICQDLTVQLDSTGNASINRIELDGGSTDNCGTVDIPANNSALVISGVIDGPLSGGLPKMVEFYVIEDIADLSAYGFGSANNGGGTDGEEFTFPSVAATAGQYIYQATDSASFHDFFGFPADYTGGFAASINGDDAIELFRNGSVVDVFGDINVDGSGEPWEYRDGWAYRKSNTGPDGTSFQYLNWTYSGPDALDGETSNSTAASSMPIASYTNAGPTIISFDCGDVGANNLILTVTDASGNSSVCTSVVTVEDNVAPEAVCQSFAVQLDGFGQGTLSGNDVDGGSTDACGVASLSTDLSTFGCADVDSTFTTVLTVTDSNGNTSTCNATVTVEDNVKPAANCRDITVALDAAGNVAITAIDIDNFSFDFCGIASTVIDVDSFSCAEVGQNTVNLTVTDVNGNDSTCSGIVTVVDLIPPMIACQDATVYLDSSGNGTVTVGDVFISATDVCGVDSSYLSQSDFSCADVGVVEIDLIVTDVNGAMGFCDVDVTIIDTVSPIAVCQDITITLDSLGMASITDNDINGGSSDACGLSLVQAESVNYTCAEVGVNAIQLLVIDSNSNSSTCVANVTVEDTTKPVAVCNDRTVQVNSNGNAIINAASVGAGSSDACGIASYVSNPAVLGCNGSGTIITLTVTDNNGNSSECNATITVVDNLNPVAICIQDIAIGLDSTGTVSLSASAVGSSSTDNCGVTSLSLSKNTFDCDDVGLNPVTLTATDAAGNNGFCNTTIDIQDIFGTCIVNCPAPQNTFTDMIGYTSARVNWDTVGNAEGYVIQGRPVGASFTVTLVINNPAQSSLVAGSLIQGTTYEWQIKAICNNNESDFTPLQTFTTLTCSTPMNPSETILSNSQVNLMWTPVAGAIGYRITGGTPSAPNAAKLDVTGQASNSFLVTGLTPGATYVWRIRAICQISPFIQSPNTVTRTFTMPVVGSSQKIEMEASATGTFNAELSMSVYPNPNEGQFLISVNNIVQDGQIVIYDMLGKEVLQQNVADTDYQQLNIDLTRFEKGTYLIRLVSGDEYITKRVVVQ